MRPYLSQIIAASIMLALAGGMMSLVVATVKPLVDDVLLAKPDALVTFDEPADIPNETVEQLEQLKQWIKTELRLEEFFSWMKDRAFVKIPILMVVIFFFRAILLYFGQYMTTKVGATVIRDLRSELQISLIGQSPGFYQTNQTGLVLSRVLSDVQRIQRVSTTVLADLVRVGAMAPCMLILVLLHDWRFTIFAAVVLPFFAYPLVRLGKRLRKASTRSQETTADAANLLTEMVGGIKVIQSFLMERVTIDRFHLALKGILRADLQAGRASALSGPIMEIVGAVAGSSLFYVAGGAIAKGKLDPGDFFVVLAGLTFLFMSIRKLNHINVEIQQALAAASRVFEMLDVKPAVKDSPDSITIPVFNHSILFENISFDYGDDVKVLDRINLEIKKGEIIALVGPSGAGKSTLANLVPRFHDPTGGRVLIDGIDLRTATLASLRANIAIVTQETVLFDDTVSDNISCVQNDANIGKIIEAATAANANEFIKELPKAYETRLGERGSRLSMGQRQRIAVARALFKNPPILILDEATSALDSQSEYLVQEALSTLLEGRSGIVIAHRLSTIRQADRILVLEAGRVVEEGTHEQLLALNGSYANLHALQFREQ